MGLDLRRISGRIARISVATSRDLPDGDEGAEARCRRIRGLEAITQDIPFIARKSRREPDDIRRVLGLPPRAGDKALVLMSFGGYGIEGLDTAALGALSGYTIATTDIPARQHSIKPAPGLLYLSERQLYESGLRYEDLVRAADVVVTKPGYHRARSNRQRHRFSLPLTRPIRGIHVLGKMPRYLRARSSTR